MRILLDENLDWRLARSLHGHEIQSVQKNGWAGIKNGVLLARVELQFDVFVSMEGSIEFQQNYAALRLAIVTLRARSNRLHDTEPLMPKRLMLLPALKPGTISAVE